MTGHRDGGPSAGPADRAAVGEALAGFAVLGRQETLAGGRLRAFTVPGWAAPSFSPVVYTDTASGPPPAEVLEAIRAVWRRPERAGRRTPCFLLPHDLKQLVPPHVSGWRPDPRPLRVIVEQAENGGEALIPARDVDVHALGTDDEREFLELVGRCFPDVAERPLLVTAPLHAAGVRTEVLIVRDPESGRLLAASAQSTRGRTAFQTWGSVDPDHRGQGLSRALQQVALSRARAAGASVSVTVTRNPRVTGVHRPCVSLWIYEQEGR